VAIAQIKSLAVGKSENRCFDFKQFSIKDDKCAMKIGTDALLLASWCSVENVSRIVDLGTGSGIIALMLAQRAPESIVVGVELEEAAALQAEENFRLSPFQSRLRAAQQSAQEHARQFKTCDAYDLVVSNPPYFNEKPKSPDHARNLARHDEFLPLKELWSAAKKVMKEEGRLALVWPMDRKGALHKVAKDAGFAMTRCCEIAGTKNHDPKRFLSEWVLASRLSSNQPSLKIERLNIELGLRQQGRPKHTDRYKELLNDFVIEWH
jgi:tRNA1Val (adenine37-N6)-methyltransferase